MLKIKLASTEDLSDRHAANLIDMLRTCYIGVTSGQAENLRIAKNVDFLS